MAGAKNTSKKDTAAPQPKPGTVVSPGAQQPAREEEPAKAVQPPTETKPTTVSDAPKPPAEAVVADQAPEQPQDNAPLPQENFAPMETDGQSVTWTASEFIAHNKSAGWYAGLVVVVLLLAGLTFLITRDMVSVSVVIVGGILIGIYANHQPRQLEYSLDSRGVGIGRKLHDYDEFRSFSIVPEGAFASIVFMPLKRFAVPTTVYYAPEDEEKIMAVLSDRLPFEQYKHDAVDSLMRRVRF